MNNAELKQAERLSRLLLVVIGLRTVLFLLELGVGLWEHSLSLLAGSGHVFADLVTVGLTIVTARLASSEVRVQSRGYQRLEGWLGLANSVSLLVIASLLLWETFQHLYRSTALGQGIVILGVAGLGVGINSLTIYLLHHDRHYSLSVRGIFLHQIADAASAVSILLSAAAGYFLHWLWVDVVTSIFVSLLILWSAIALLLASFKVLRSY